MNCHICENIIQTQDYESIKAHYKVCARQKNVEITINRVSINIDNKTICIKCGSSFTNQDWRKHSRKTVCKSIKSGIVHFDPSQNISLSRTFNTNFSDYTCIQSASNIAKQMTKASFGRWASQNKHIDRRALVKYMTSYFNDAFYKLFTTKIPLISLADIKKLRIKLFKGLKPQDFFDHSLIDSLLKKMTPSNRKKAILFLNKLAEKNFIFNKRQVPVFKRQIRQRKPARVRDVLHFIGALLSTNKSALVHIGIDFLIIFQSGIRFLSDKNRFTQAYLADPSHIRMKIGKTDTLTIINLGDQVLKLMQKINWNGWHCKTTNLFRRMSRWAGVKGYSLKYTIMTFLALTTTPSNQLARIQAGHRSLKAIDYYTKKIQNKHVRDQLNNIPISTALFSTKTSEEVQKICRERDVLPNDDYEHFSLNFLQNCIKRVYITQQQFVNDATLEIVAQSITVSFPHENNENNQQSSQSDEDEDDLEQLQPQKHSSQKKTYLNFDQVEIGGRNFKNFGIHDLYENEKCIFCQKSKTSSFCICLENHRELQRLPCIKLISKLTSFSPKLPEKYFGNLSEQYCQIKTLITLRHFQYVQEAFCLFNKETLDIPLQHLQSKQFKRFQKQIYFPPIKLILSGKSYLKGQSSFGLQAAEKIAKDVVIGQYAADIVNQYGLKSCKRLDTIMQLGKSKDGLKLFVCPITSMGYVCLLNSMEQASANCASLMVCINGMAKIIIYTKREILPGEQLAYYYCGRGWQNKDMQDSFKEKSVIQKELIVPTINQQIDNNTMNALKTQQIKKCKQNQKITSPNNELNYSKQIIPSGLLKQAINIQYQPNYCYAYITLVIFRMLKNEIVNFDYYTKNLIFKKLCSLKKIIKQFKPNQENIQNDAIQFFQFLNNKLYRNSPFPTIVFKQIIACLDCQFQTSNFLQQKINYLHLNQICHEYMYDKIEKNCIKCNKNKYFHRQICVVSDPFRVIYCFKRFDNKLRKLDGKIQYLQEITIRKNKYKPQFIVMHQGQSIKEGHFYLLHYDQNLYIDSRKIYLKQNIIHEHIYALIYKRYENNWESRLFYGQTSKNEDIYQIASIVKVITVLVCLQLALVYNISPETKIKLSKNNFPNSTQLQFQFQLCDFRTLINNCLVVSCCRSAYTLAIYFGQKLKDKTSKSSLQQIFICKMNQFLHKMQLYDTFISDCTGLEPSISNEKDLSNLLNIIKQNKTILDSFKKPSILHEGNIIENSNKLLPYVFGKTGFTKNRLKNFIGFDKKGKKIIALYFQQAIIWEAIKQILDK